jgi:hypothetical protein
MLLKDWSAEFVETEKLKDPLPVDIEHPQVIRFVQIVFDRLKMSAISLPRESKRNLKGHKLAGSPGSEFLEELGIVERFV